MSTHSSVQPELRAFHKAAARFASGTDTPEKFLENGLEKIARFEPALGAFAAMNVAAAREAAARSAKRWEAGRPLSRIDGMPVGVKDVAETADMPTAMGSPIYAGWRPLRDSAIVAALREAGAIVVGKTVTTEFASTPPAGTRNPWDLQRTPGGSSSGSAAAVGAGFLSAALGTQVIGSILRPASFCGTFGFKPSIGALNRGGSHDYMSQSCAGVLAASLEDAWNFCWAVAARVGGDPGHPGLAGPEAMPAPIRPRALAVLETAGWTSATPPPAKEKFTAAVARLRAQGIAVLDRNNHARVGEIETVLLDAMALSRRINAWESRWPLNSYRNEHRDKSSAHMLERLAEAEAMSLEDYRGAIAARARIRGLFAALQADAAGAITLSANGPAPVGLQSTGDPAFAVPGSLLGVPAVSLPVFEIDGLPLGLQALGFEQQDAALISLAAWLRDAETKAAP
jgi:Asp-tRNA(Asn)/Glu-tRNA(Gln) amidotransferase A subunit family amidase